MAVKNPPGVIVITGASSGIGRALSLCYAAPGTEMLLCGRDSARLQEAAADAEAKGATAATAAIDICDRRAMADCLTRFDTAHPVDLLIANAGADGTAFPPETRTYDVFEVNVSGVFNSVEPILPRMLTRHHGQIAIVSSLAGFRGLPTSVAYSSSKAAVKAYGEAMRGRYRRDGIAVNVVTPGFVETPMTASNKFPMPFLWTPERAADAIKKGLARDKGRIAFPWPLFAGVRLLDMLPDALATAITSRGPHKS